MFRLKAFAIILFFGFFATFFISTRVQVSNASTAVIPSTPSDVAASDGDYINKVGIMWSAVRGATVYRVLRSTTNNASTATEVGSTPAYYFFDTTTVQGQTYFYWVRAENASGSSALSSADQGNAAVGTPRQGGLQAMEPPPTSVNNPVTAAKAYLGKTLFWDEQLSSTNTVSCGTCHRPAAGGSDPRTSLNDLLSRAPGADLVLGTADDTFGSKGVPAHGADGLYTFSSTHGLDAQVTSRKSPSYLNGGFSPNGLFWDGRATNVFRDPISNALILQGLGALESQAAEPPLDSKEMAHSGANWPEVAQKIASVKPLMLAEDIPTSLSK